MSSRSIQRIGLGTHVANAVSRTAASSGRGGDRSLSLSSILADGSVAALAGRAGAGLVGSYNSAAKKRPSVGVPSSPPSSSRISRGLDPSQYVYEEDQCKREFLTSLKNGNESELRHEESDESAMPSLLPLCEQQRIPSEAPTASSPLSLGEHRRRTESFKSGGSSQDLRPPVYITPAQSQAMFLQDIQRALLTPTREEKEEEEATLRLSLRRRKAGQLDHTKEEGEQPKCQKQEENKPEKGSDVADLNRPLPQSSQSATTNDKDSGNSRPSNTVSSSRRAAAEIDEEVERLVVNMHLWLSLHRSCTRNGVVSTAVSEGIRIVFASLLRLGLVQRAYRLYDVLHSFGVRISKAEIGALFSNLLYDDAGATSELMTEQQKRLAEQRRKAKAKATAAHSAYVQYDTAAPSPNISTARGKEVDDKNEDELGNLTPPRRVLRNREQMRMEGVLISQQRESEQRRMARPVEVQGNEKKVNNQNVDGDKLAGSTPPLASTASDLAGGSPYPILTLQNAADAPSSSPPERLAAEQNHPAKPTSCSVTAVASHPPRVDPHRFAAFGIDRIVVPLSSIPLKIALEKGKEIINEETTQLSSRPGGDLFGTTSNKCAHNDDFCDDVPMPPRTPLTFEVAMGSLDPNAFWWDLKDGDDKNMMTRRSITTTTTAPTSTPLKSEGTSLNNVVRNCDGSKRSADEKGDFVKSKQGECSGDTRSSVVESSASKREGTRIIPKEKVGDGGADQSEAAFLLNIRTLASSSKLAREGDRSSTNTSIESWALALIQWEQRYLSSPSLVVPSSPTPTPKSAITDIGNSINTNSKPQPEWYGTVLDSLKKRTMATTTTTTVATSATAVSKGSVFISPESVRLDKLSRRALETLLGILTNIPTPTSGNGKNNINSNSYSPPSQRLVALASPANSAPSFLTCPSSSPLLVSWTPVNYAIAVLKVVASDTRNRVLSGASPAAADPNASERVDNISAYASAAELCLRNNNLTSLAARCCVSGLVRAEEELHRLQHITDSLLLSLQKRKSPSSKSPSSGKRSGPRPNPKLSNNEVEVGEKEAQQKDLEAIRALLAGLVASRDVCADLGAINLKPIVPMLREKKYKKKREKEESQGEKNTDDIDSDASDLANVTDTAEEYVATLWNGVGEASTGLSSDRDEADYDCWQTVQLYDLSKPAVSEFLRGCSSSSSNSSSRSSTAGRRHLPSGASAHLQSHPSATTTVAKLRQDVAHRLSDIIALYKVAAHAFSSEGSKKGKRRQQQAVSQGKGGETLQSSSTDTAGTINIASMSALAEECHLCLPAAHKTAGLFVNAFRMRDRGGEEKQSGRGAAPHNNNHHHHHLGNDSGVNGGGAHVDSGVIGVGGGGGGGSSDRLKRLGEGLDSLLASEEARLNRQQRGV